MSDKCIMVMPWELEADEIGWFHAAVATDEHAGGVDLVSKLIASGAMELWVLNDGDAVLVAITRLVTYPDGYRELLVQMMAGDGVTSSGAHLECERAMMKYAIKNGCQRMVAAMRPSIYEHMSKHLGPRYVPEYVILSLAPEDVNLDSADGGAQPEGPADHHRNQTHSETKGNQGNE